MLHGCISKVFKKKESKQGFLVLDAASISWKQPEQITSTSEAYSVERLASKVQNKLVLNGKGDKLDIWFGKARFIVLPNTIRPKYIEFDVIVKVKGASSPTILQLAAKGQKQIKGDVSSTIETITDTIAETLAKAIYKDYGIETSNQSYSTNHSPIKLIDIQAPTVVSSSKPVVANQYQGRISKIPSSSYYSMRPMPEEKKAGKSINLIQ
jgi:hypothetical protein